MSLEPLGRTRLFQEEKKNGSDSQPSIPSNAGCIARRFPLSGTESERRPESGSSIDVFIFTIAPRRELLKGMVSCRWS